MFCIPVNINHAVAIPDYSFWFLILLIISNINAC